jgi:hypothetical protein
MRKSGKVEEAETDEEAEAGRRFKLQLQENWFNFYIYTYSFQIIINLFDLKFDCSSKLKKYYAISHLGMWYAFVNKSSSKIIQIWLYLYSVWIRQEVKFKVKKSKEI